MPSPPIRDFVVSHFRLDPIETELGISVWLDKLTPTSIIRGRLTGPRCIYASTVEIAYTMREVSRSDHIELRVTIPEPCWWDPQSPFLYEGVLEHWENEHLSQRSPITHGIRDLQLTSQGLKLNGRSVILRGRAVEPTVNETELRRLHDCDINAVMTSFRGEREWFSNTALWALANRYGLFVLCRGQDEFDSRHFGWIQDIHASAFGCVARGKIGEESHSEQCLAVHHRPIGSLIGVESNATRIPVGAAFILCQEAELSSLAAKAMPKIVLTRKTPDPLPSRADVIGWIEVPS
jgi:hypothetical protein